MSDFKKWKTDEVITWLQDDLGLANLDVQKWKKLPVSGRMLPRITDELLLNELGVESQLHRETILEEIKELMQESQHPQKPIEVEEKMASPPQKPVQVQEKMPSPIAQTAQVKEVEFSELGKFDLRNDPLAESKIITDSEYEALKRATDPQPPERDEAKNRLSQLLSNFESYDSEANKSSGNKPQMQESARVGISAANHSGIQINQGPKQDSSESNVLPGAPLVRANQSETMSREEIVDETLQTLYSRQPTIIDMPDSSAQSESLKDQSECKTPSVVWGLSTSEEIIEKILEGDDQEEIERKKLAHALKAQLEKEERFGPVTEEKFEAIKSSISKSCDEFKKALRVMKRHLQPIDIPKLKQLMSLSMDSCQKVSDQEIYLFIGYTGAGKTTTLLYLYGVTVEMTEVENPKGGFLKHLKIVEYPDNPDPLVKEMATSPFSESCTSGINAINAAYTKNNRKMKALLCDTPGIGENRSLEQSIAGQKAIDIALKSCKAVLPVVVLAADAFGNRMDAVKNVSRFIAGMFRNFNNVEKGSIQFYFTKADSTESAKGHIQGRVNEFIEKINDQEGQDETFIKFLQHLQDAVDDTDDMCIIDPLSDDQQRNKILTKLAKVRKIQNPQETFKMQLGFEVTEAMTRQIQINLDAFVKKHGLELKNYELMEKKVSDIQYLSQTLEMSFLDEKFNQAIELIKSDMKDQLESCTIQADFNSSKVSKELLTLIKTNKGFVSQLLRILQETFFVTQVDVTPDDFDLLVKKIADNLASMLKDIHNAGEIMSSLRLVHQYFGDTVDSIEQTYLHACDWCQNQFNAIQEEALAAQQEFNFQQFSEKVLEMDSVLPTIESFVTSKKDATQALRGDLLAAVERKSNESVQAALNFNINTSEERLSDSIQSYENNFRIICNGLNCLNMTKCCPDNRFEAQKACLLNKIEETFNVNLKSIRNAVQSENLDLKELEQVKNYLSLLQRLQEGLSVPTSCVKNYVIVVNDIYKNIELCIQKVESIINCGYQDDIPFDDRQLIKSMTALEGLVWIDQFNQSNSNIQDQLQEIYKRIKAFQKFLSSNAQQALDQNHFEYLEKLLNKLNGLGEKYEQFYDEKKQDFSQKIEKKVQDIEDFIQKGKTEISYSSTENYLELFKNYKNETIHFSHLTNKLRVVERQFMQHLEEYKTNKFSQVTLDSKDSYKKLQSIIHEIKFIESKRSLVLDEVFQPGALRQALEKNLQEEVDKIELKRHNLNLQNKQAELEKLRDLVQFSIDLDKHFDHSKKFQIVLMDIEKNLHSEQKQELSELIEFLKQYDFESAQLSLSNLQGHIKERGIQQTKKFIKISIENCENNKMVLNSFAKIEDIRNFNLSIKRLLDAQAQFSNGDDMEAPVLGEKIMEQIQDTVKDSKNAMNSFFILQIKKIKSSLQNNSFQITIELLRNLRDFQQIAQQYLTSETVDEIEIIDSLLENQIHDVVESYATMEIKDYQLRPPKYIIQKMSQVKDFHMMEQSIISISQKVKEKYYTEIASLRTLGTSMSLGLRNETFLCLKRSINTLPQDMQQEIQNDLDEFVSDYKQHISADNQQFNIMVQNGSSEALNETLNRLYSAQRFDDYNGMQQQIMQRSQEMLDQIKAMMTEFDNFQNLVNSIEYLLRFEVVSGKNSNLKNLIDQSKHLVSTRLDESLVFISQQLQAYLKNDQDAQKFPQIEKELLFVSEIVKTIGLGKINLDENHAISNFNNLVSLQQKQVKEAEDILKAHNSLLNKQKLRKVAEVLRNQRELTKINEKIETIYHLNGSEIKLRSAKIIEGQLEQICQRSFQKFQKPMGNAGLKLVDQRDKFYQERFDAFQTIQNITAHIGGIKVGDQPTQDVLKQMISKDKTEIKQMKALCVSHINKLSPQQLASDSLQAVNNLINHLQSFRRKFQEEDFAFIDPQLQEVDDSIGKVVKEIKTLYEKRKNLQNLAYCLVALKEVSDNIESQKMQVDNQIDLLIKAETKAEGQSIAHLSQELENTLSISAQNLLQDHQQFQAHEILRKNSVLHNPQYGLAYVVEHMESKSFDVDEFKGKNKVEKVWDKCVSLFKPGSLDKGYLKTCYESFLKCYGKPDGHKYSGFLGKFLKPRIELDKINEEIIKNIPVHIGKNLAWTNDLKANKIPKMVAQVFGAWTVLNSKFFFDNQGQDQSNGYLFTPHPAQVISIFRMLGLGNFRPAEKLENHIVQVKTGEGKSITIAVVACVLALLGYDVYCACYSQHLQERDFENFKELFQALNVVQQIHYGTMEQLCEKMINEQGDVRTQVQSFIETNKIPQSLNKKACSVLIIDEVDSFVDKQFYGALYQPLVLLKKTCIENLLIHIWKSRSNSSLKLKDIQKTEVYKQCCNQFKNEWNELIDGAIRRMITDLKDIDQHSNYIVKDNKIGYIYGDRVMFNINRGYLTSFTYIKEWESNNITQQSMSSNIGLQVSCGSFSYAQIPFKFEAILGISGTVETMSQTQRQIIFGEYHFRLETHIPSVFGENKLDFSPIKSVFVENKKDFYTRLRKQIDAGLVGANKSKRAVLVFFKDENELMNFYESETISDIKANVNILTEQATSAEIKSVVKKATQSGQITLMTRNFGRGTDFIVLDEFVKSNGGTCTIQTFPSESHSEEVQLKGRSARQGQDGSYVLVLLQDDLFPLGITEEAIKAQRNQNKLYEYIQDKIELNYNNQQQETMSSLQYSKEEHQKSEKLIQNLLVQNQKEVKSIIIAQNKYESDNVSKTMMLIDATASMTALLTQTKSTISVMFQRIAEILQDNSIDSNRVMMKLGFYRNYDSLVEKLYESSNWEVQASNLQKFMWDQIQVRGGWGNEAIEVGLFYAEKEIANGLSQVILIGDAPPNTKADFQRKRSEEHGLEYWNKHLPHVQHYEHHLKALDNAKVSVHTVYLDKPAKDEFEKIAKASGGTSIFLDINGSDAADKLTGLISTMVLKNVGGANGDKFVEQYKQKFGGFV